MNNNLFLYHNYDMLLIAIQALDPYAFDNLTSRSSNLNIFELFTIRTSSIMKYANEIQKHNLYYTIILAQDISSVVLNMYVQDKVYKILTDIIKYQGKSNLYSLSTMNYINRFKLNYRKTFNPYLIGAKLYSSNKQLVQLSLINIFLIYKTYERHGVYFLYFYLFHNSKNT
uniref:Uncharacterized protein n=1 Tax=Dermonema virens TaxID=1077399 RepID=A0A1G4NRY8_9FLOR|nr:Hypothetical protein ORF_6 [Dermonema virens]SCW21442.1 Hypothetical protein ORF_6 [Dermonema virens]